MVKAKSSAPSKTPRRRKTAVSSKLGSDVSQTFRIYQISGSVSEGAGSLDPFFTALNRPAKSKDCWDDLLGLFSSPGIKGLTVVGLVPQGFTERSGVKPEAWQKLVDRPDGKDAYLLNPSPSEEGLFPNALSKAFLENPSLVGLYAKLFKSVGIPEGNVVAPTPCLEMSMAPYMIAKVSFWKAYIDYIQNDWGPAMRNLSKEDARQLVTGFEPQGILAGETPRSLLVGRLLPFFLRSDKGKAFQATKVALPNREKELNAHLRSLRQLKDTAISQQASWLVQCWLNYRNLYLFQVNGKDWCQKHLPSISLPLATTDSKKP